MKYLVTGGAGFIGSNIVERLLELNHEVRVLDNFSTGRPENLDAYSGKIELIEGDIRDIKTVVKAVKGIDYVLHQAALPSVPRSVADPLTSNAVNLNGTLNLLEASRQAGVKKFVVASSSSIYGESKELPKHEKMTPHPLSPYAITKLTGEHYCRVFWELYKFPTCCLRYFNVFGPRQDPQSEYAAVIPRFTCRLLAGQPPTVYGDGEQSRDFTYVDNAVQANLLAAETDEMVGNVFNVAGGGQITLNEVLDKLRAIISVGTEAVYEEPRSGDIRHSYAAIEKIEKHGFAPTVDFEEGLKKTVAFFRSAVFDRTPSGN
ncbi:MAG: LPS biosynthesis protein WbpP [Candidatus Zixiibacteriota bacterium]|nr:MAG: LPS biosynthesis protein WbpP [candidate division Zixibacteria bacterium]